MAVTANKGYDLPTTGSLVGAWGANLNTAVTSVIDTNLGGFLSIALTNLNVVLTAAQAQNAIVRFTGTLTANVQITLPCIGFIFVENYTLSGYAITITNGVGTSVIVPQSTIRQIISDATNGMRAINLPPPGTSFDFRAGAPALHPSLAGEYLLEDGSAVSRTTYAALFNAIGVLYGAGNGSTTFNLPDSRGRVNIGRDDMGGIAANRVTGFTGLGNTGGEQYHALSVAELAQHNHGGQTGIDFPDHSHQVVASVNVSGTAPGGGGGAFGSNPIGITSSGASTRHQHTINIDGSNAPHNNIQPSIIANRMIKT